jgi:inosose dehydratase
MIRVATASVNWNNDDLGEGIEYPFPMILDRAREAGYDAIEYHPLFGDDTDALNREAEARGITWCGTYHPIDLVSGPLTDEQRHAVEGKAARLAALGCHDMVVAQDAVPERIAIAGQVPEDGSQSLPSGAYPLAAANLHAAAAVARRHDVRLHFHNHVGTWIETPAELGALLHHLDTSLVDLCFDTGHYAYGGGGPLAFMRDNLEAIGYLHLKDVDASVLVEARRHGWSFLEALKHVIFCPLGDGSASIPEILTLLNDSRFEGWVVVEQDTCHGDPTVVARQNRNSIARQVGDA